MTPPVHPTDEPGRDSVAVPAGGTPPAVHVRVCPVRVGRDREVAKLAETLEAVRTSGAGRLLLVSGVAGVGKSRLATEVQRLAARAGMAGLEGQCRPDAGIPYAPFVQALRRRTRSMPPSTVAELFDGPAALGAALLPEVARQVGLPPVSPAAEDLFAAVWQLLARLVRPGGGLLLVEDLHWADPDSLRLLANLARELSDLPIAVVGTYRSDEMHRRHPLYELLVELGRERRYDEVPLDPLGREQVREMLSAIFDGTEVGDEFTDVVLDRTGGNPFFVEELSKVLVDRGDVFRAADDWQRRDLVDIQLPESVRETLLSRARSLDDTALAVLRVAALAGDELSLPVLAAAAGVPPSRVDDVVRDGIALQLLTERRDAAGPTYAFRHALTREAFADELVGPDRLRVHRALAEAVAEAHADDLDAVAAEIADHYTAAGQTREAHDFCLRAARFAAAGYAVDEADRRFDQVLRLRQDPDPERLAILLEAIPAAGFGELSRLQLSFVHDARALARRLGDPVAESRALHSLVDERWQAGDGPGGLALAREAVELVHGLDDHQEAAALRHLTRRLQLMDEDSEVEALLPGAIELATRSGNLAALSGLYGTRMMCSPFGAAFEDAFAAGLAAARQARDLPAESNLWTNSGYVRVWCGDFAGSRRALVRGEQLRSRIAPSDRYPAAGLAWLLSLTGEYDEAERLAVLALASRSVPSRIVALTALYEVADRTGRPEAAEWAEQLWATAMDTGESQRSVPAIGARVRQALRTQGTDAALAVVRPSGALSRGMPSKGSHWMFSPDVAAALAAEGSAEDLEQWVAAVGRLTELDPNPHNRVADTLCRAHLLQVSGDVVGARAAFTSAARTYAAMPCPARAAEGLLGLAALEWAAGSPDASGDAAQAAVVTAERVGATVLAHEAALAAERAEAPPVLATVLVTDIVGSTAMAASLGDRDWTALLARHDAIVRRELARSRGREIDTAGDGFLIAFDTPAQAIRSAAAIRDALAQAGIRVRAGLHTGECREKDGKLTGLAVHIAARVGAAAAGGEVWVSATVRDLVGGSGLEFADRGSHTLKGVPGEWRLYAVVP